MKDFQVGWITFIQDEVEALNEAVKSATLLHNLHPAKEQADLQDEHKDIVGVLRDAAKYITANIGDVNPVNKFVPGRDVPEFKLTGFTLGRLNGALTALGYVYDTLSKDKREQHAALLAQRKVHKALAAMRDHVQWLLNRKYNGKSAG